MRCRAAELRGFACCLADLKTFIPNVQHHVAIVCYCVGLISEEDLGFCLQSCILSISRKIVAMEKKATTKSNRARIYY